MKYSRLLLFLTLLFSLADIQAQWVQLGEKIVGENLEDYSGISVSLNSVGSIIAIGAFGNDGNGEDSGHVRVYENIEGIWTQIGDDINGESSGDNSGHSVSLSSDGTIVAIGAPSNNGNGYHSGQVRVYENINGTWTQIGEDIDGENAEDSCCQVSISADGKIVAAGARWNDGFDNNSGHVRIFENLNGTWTQIGEDIDGENYGDWSGNSVSLSFDGTIVAIGAPSNNGNGYHSGQVRIYENINGTWTQIGEDIYGESEFDESGESVSLSSDGTIVAIGAPINTDSGTNAGQVRVFKYLNGTWSQIGEDIDASHSGDFFGRTLSLNSDGSIVAIKGSWSTTNNTNSGQVRVYKNINGTWTQLSDSIEGDGPYFGRSISLSSSGSIVGIGNYLSDKNGNSPGIVRIFENENLGISDLRNKTVSIYPNPSTGIINFNLLNNTIQKIYISDITGKLILEINSLKHNEVINITNFDNGVYIANIQVEGGIIIKKIIKK